MIGYLNGLAVGLIAPHAASSLMRGDYDSLTLAGALVACNVVSALIWFVDRGVRS